MAMSRKQSKPVKYPEPAPFGKVADKALSAHHARGQRKHKTGGALS